eukprot:5806663-Alexandrium_andersonii.AAC.1
MAALLAAHAVARVQAGADDALRRLHFGPVQADAAPLRVPWRDLLQRLRHVDHVSDPARMGLGRPDVELP